jgi:F-type H+-transporting ATPase subunit b
MEHEASILSDPIVWYSLGIVIFFFGLWKARGPILALIDAEIAKVRAELDQAKKLRAEAEANSAEYEKRHKAALLEAEAILAQAKADADLLRAEAEADLERSIKTQEAHALARIKNAEEAAVEEVRGLVIAQAMASARRELAHKIEGAVEKALIDDAVGALGALADDEKAA